MNKNIAGKTYWNTDSSPASNKADHGRFIEIIKGCRDYKSDSQKKLYKQYYGYAMGIALAYSISREDAVEVVNDSFIKVFKNIKSYNDSQPFKPWFRKIVVNAAIDKARSQKKFNHRYEFAEIEQLSPINAETELNAKQIYLLLNELPDLLRFVFNMYEIEGFSHREIGKKLDIAESYSRTCLARAKTKLRQLYRNNFMND